MIKNKNIKMFIGDADREIFTMIKMCKEWKKKNDGKVIAFDPMNSFYNAGLIDYSISASDKDWMKKLMKKNKNGKYKFDNSLLILQDYRMLITENATPSGFIELITYLNIDIFISTAYPKHVHERISYFVNDWYIFHVEEENSKFNERLPQYAKCQNALNAVNEYVTTNGIEIGSESPHIIVSQSTNDLEFVNMNHKINKTKTPVIL